MDPSTQTSSSTGYDDPVIAEQARNMTKAIFQYESGTDYNAKGDVGTSTGAGQWQPETWKSQAQDVLGDSNAPMTQQNQSVVAQGTIRKLIKEGKNAAQIAAIWNSGNDTNWESKVGTTTINGKQIKYNVPQYVKGVTDLYQQYKSNPSYKPVSGNSFSDPLTNIASGNSGANLQHSKGALKGALQVVRDASGVDTSPVVKGQLANAPAFAADVEAEKNFLKPQNLEEQKGSDESGIGAGLLGNSALGGGKLVNASKSGLVNIGKSPLGKSVLKAIGGKVLDATGFGLVYELIKHLEGN